MPETAKQTVKSRTETHSDVAASPAAKAYQAALTERQFGALILAHLREAKGGAFTLRDLKEEWIATDDGMVHEISAEADVDESNPIRPQAAPEPDGDDVESKAKNADRGDRFTWKQGDIEILPPRQPEPTDAEASETDPEE